MQIDKAMQSNIFIHTYISNDSIATLKKKVE